MPGDAEFGHIGVVASAAMLKSDLALKSDWETTPHHDSHSVQGMLTQILCI